MKIDIIQLQFNLIPHNNSYNAIFVHNRKNGVHNSRYHESIIQKHRIHAVIIHISKISFSMITIVDMMH